MSELKQALLDVEFLQECNNSVNLALSVTRKELADANARIAQAEGENKRMRELLVEIQSYAETYLDLEPRMKHIIDCAKAALEGKS